MKSTSLKPILHISFIIVFLIITNICNGQSVDDKKAFEKLRTDLFVAFKNDDTAIIASYHHPNVVKALSYDKFLIGRNSVINDISSNFKYFNFIFKEHQIESFVIHGDMATEISTFTMEGFPKTDSKPFTFKGRSMVVYVRYQPSPVGWVIFREMVQPESN